MKTPTLLITGLLAVVSVSRLWLERDLTGDLRSQELLPLKLDLNVRDEMSQEAFAAALGGMRALLASYYELEAFAAFSQQPSVWHKVDQYYALCTRLQPLSEEYWDMHGWMLGTNASEAYGSEGEASKGSELEMRKLYREKGIQILLKGLQYLPKSYKLNRRLADTFAFANRVVNPEPDYESAARYYLRASKCEGAMPWMKRFYALNYSKIPGKEREGYMILRQQYNDPDNRYPSSIIRMKALEEQLNVPYPIRIPEAIPKVARKAMPWDKKPNTRPTPLSRG